MGNDGTKRGRYKRELTTKDARKDGQNWLRKHAELREKILKESPLADSVVKNSLADSTADLILHGQYFRELLSIGKLSSDESRAMTGLPSNIKRLFAELGMSGSDLGADKPKPISDAELIG